MSIINNALSGSHAAQVALNTTSQNIANLMTPGYTRQGALMTSVRASQTGSLSAGDGVTVPSLIRFSDGYKSQQMWQAASELAQRSIPQPYLTQLEQVMGDDESGINRGLDGFFGALNAASVEPTSIPLRQQVITSAEALAQRFNSLSQVLANQRASIAQQRVGVVDQINSVSTAIADLNREIAIAQATGTNASSLVDARDQQIDALATLAALQVVDQADGTRSVSLRDGQPLVVGGRASRMEVQTQPDGTQSLTLSFASESFTITSKRLGGQIGGLDDYEREVLAPMRQSVSDMAREVADKVNTQLAAGYGLSGTSPTPAPPDGPLFRFDASGTTGVLRVLDGVLAADLAFSSDPAKPGNSDNLLAVIGLKRQPISVTSLGTVLMGDANTQLIGQVATHSQQNQASLNTAETVRNQAEESWKSTSGVNQDEEAVNLIQYQQMYQANLKVIAVANALFDSTLAMMAG
jgi:flagellar hook-associated protein 1 FlgK